MPPVPDVNNPHPAFAQIADDLRGKIKDGVIEVGKRLPSQRDLASQYGVAPGTIQQALGELAADGIVSRGSTRGTFVLKMPGEPNASPEFQMFTEQMAELADRVAFLEKVVLEPGRGDD